MLDTKLEELIPYFQKLKNSGFPRGAKLAVERTCWSINQLCKTLFSINENYRWLGKDYRKAFDTTLHELIGHLTRETTITYGEVRIQTELILYRRAVVPEDSLSQLQLCTSLLPLSVALRNTQGCYCDPSSSRKHKAIHHFTWMTLNFTLPGTDISNCTSGWCRYRSIFR